MQCDRHQRDRLRALTSEFDARGVEFVVPRGHEDLPASHPGSDLDLFVAPRSFDRAMRAAEAAGFTAGGSRVENAVRLLRQGLAQPKAALAYAVETPGELLRYVRRQLQPGSRTRRGLRERHYLDAGLDIHLFNHLAYTSPMNGAKIRVDPAIEAVMLERRHKGRLGWAPAPPDELTHLICRGVFDYFGSFPDYYGRRCNNVLATVRSDPHDDEQFRRLLEPVFFRAADLVYDHVCDGRYDAIRGALFRFTGY